MRRDLSSGKCRCPDGQVEDSLVAAGSSTIDTSIVGLHVCVDSAAVQNQARIIQTADAVLIVPFLHLIRRFYSFLRLSLVLK